MKNGQIIGTSSLKGGLKSTAIMPLAPALQSPFSVGALVTTPDGAKTRVTADYRNSSHHFLKSK